MGKPLRDLTGQKFGALTALRLGPKLKPTAGAWWLCECACGTKKSIRSTDLVWGKIRSCGCLWSTLKSEASKRHGMKGTRTYSTWQAMKTRCNNPNSSSYARYGGRGIKVCESWALFENFLNDMGECPDGMSLDRIDVNGNYEPGNCRWADRVVQANNTRKNVYVEYQGERLTRTQWERKLGLGNTTLRGRLRSGMALEEALKPLEL